MTEWLLSAHNTQESLGISRPAIMTMAEATLDDQITWFVGQLVGDPADLDPTLKPSAFVQGRCYLNIGYFVRNMGLVLPFDPESVGVPANLVPADLRPPRPPIHHRLTLPLRFRRTYRWAADFYRRRLPRLDRRLREIYWALREGKEDPLPLIWELFAPDLYNEAEDNARAHIVASLTITALDGVLRQQAPELLSLFAGQKTATSLMGQRIWELRQAAESCGDEVRRMLQEGIADLEAYEALPTAAPLVEGVRAFLRQYGHRGFRHEVDFATERLADRPEHVLLAIASQMQEEEPPEVRAEAAQRVGLEALRRMNPVRRAFWQWLLRWGQRLIAWREESKSVAALRQAAYGLAARILSRHFYPDQPDDTTMFYTLEEFLNFVRSHGKEQVDPEVLEYRRAQFELYRTQPPPPDLIWYDPHTHHWRPALEEEEGEETTAPATRLEGIAASAGQGPVEGIAMVTNDPLEAGRRLLEMDEPVILVTRLTDPAWSGLFRRLSGVVTELGGVISHAAIVARENGLPAVVGVPDVTRLIRDGQRVRVDGAAGTVEILD